MNKFGQFFGSLCSKKIPGSYLSTQALRRDLKMGSCGILLLAVVFTFATKGKFPYFNLEILKTLELKNLFSQNRTISIQHFC